VEFKHLRSLTAGEFVTIGDDVVIGKNIALGSRTGVGRGTFIDSEVTVGDRVSISRYVSIMTSTHDHLAGKRRAGPMVFVGPQSIGEGSWIGTHAVILPQVRKIGAYSIVAAGAVVTKDVEDNCVVAGNPARVIKRLEPLETQ
jgi:acetyltransferase-like isoleucine patch superfamily enzyme